MWIGGNIVAFSPNPRTPPQNRRRGPYFKPKAYGPPPYRPERRAILSLSRAQVTNRTGYVPPNLVGHDTLTAVAFEQHP